MPRTDDVADRRIRERIIFPECLMIIIITIINQLRVVNVDETGIPTSHLSLMTLSKLVKYCRGVNHVRE